MKVGYQKVLVDGRKWNERNQTLTLPRKHYAPQKTKQGNGDETGIDISYEKGTESGIVKKGPRLLEYCNMECKGFGRKGK